MFPCCLTLLSAVGLCAVLLLVGILLSSFYVRGNPGVLLSSFYVRGNAIPLKQTQQQQIFTYIAK
jgi:hypothetical protein